jgi:hypothetical protein
MALSLVLVSRVAADDPPAPAGKKAAPEDKPAPKAKEEPKEELPAPDVDSKEILERINKNLREAEQRLEKKDTSDGTRRVQKDIVKDIDALIEQSKKQQQQQNDPQGGSGMSNSKNQRNPQASSSRRPSGRRPERRPDSGSQAKAGGTSNQGGAGRTSGTGPDKMAEMLKDIWGHLPETMRMEMDAYARQQFMPKYSDLLREYYKTIAERRRPENER